MGYYIDEHSMNLDDLQTRLDATDLIPSHRPLLDGFKKKMGLLEKTGVKSVAHLRIRLKSKKSLASLSEDSGISSDYLVLLRRAVEGFFPKPQPLSAFDWLNKEVVAKLEKSNVKNSLQLYEATSSGIDAFARSAKVKTKDLSEFLALSDLSRIQWVGPTFARVLLAAGFASAAMVAKANPDELYEAVLQTNENARFYKGKVGLRDIKRLIAAAAYVP